jgi:hypothetical protein
MKYLLALIAEETGFDERTPEERAAAMREWDVYTRATIDAGVHLGGEGLQPSATATTVRIQADGDPIVSDGPFAETKEQLGGLYIVDVPDLDAALAIAARLPSALVGSIEVRPIPAYGG